ncbi:MAG: KH domain-containing protein [Caldilineales bacterium]|nr:KH domain-containing protein [Caldilineales bacterium]MCW5858934.1 KH domain-containing protein [Caldilineales bacterium]
MKELVEYLTQTLVDHPEQVLVTTRRSGPSLFVEVTAASSDVGRLIGRHGRTAEAIRTVAKVAGARKGLRVTVDIA